MTLEFQLLESVITSTLVVGVLVVVMMSFVQVLVALVAVEFQTQVLKAQNQV